MAPTNQTHPTEVINEMSRWEDDGGGNIGSDYEWLPETLTEGAVDEKQRTEADTKQLASHVRESS